MKRRIQPPLIIVYGNMIEGMTGRFINYTYEDLIQNQYKKPSKQLSLLKPSPIFEIKRDDELYVLEENENIGFGTKEKEYSKESSMKINSNLLYNIDQRKEVNHG